MSATQSQHETNIVGDLGRIQDFKKEGGPKDVSAYLGLFRGLLKQIGTKRGGHASPLDPRLVTVGLRTMFPRKYMCGGQLFRDLLCNRPTVS